MPYACSRAIPCWTACSGTIRDSKTADTYGKQELYFKRNDTLGIFFQWLVIRSDIVEGRQAIFYFKLFSTF